MARQVKSKQRVADHGEVFTAEREVQAMCDLVKQETERIDIIKWDDSINLKYQKWMRGFTAVKAQTQTNKSFI